ncbi:MAG TPA: hypothetical protein VF477_03235, partial [Mycobacterium sp.]
TDVDALRASRCTRASDLEEQEKARLRMLRAQCRGGATCPGRFVARHPRMVRGPNDRGSIHVADSPAGLMHT